MSLVVPPGFGLASIVLTGTPGTSPYVTTIGVSLSEAGGDFTAAANAVMNAYTLAFRALTSNDLIIQRVSLHVGSDGPSGSVDSDLAAAGGTRSVVMAPTAMSVIARKLTNDLGRRGRGRMFLPGMCAEGDVTESGAIETASIGAFEAAMADFLIQLQNDATYPSVPGYLLHSEAADTPPPTLITGMAPAPLVGWIRGRIR